MGGSNHFEGKSAYEHVLHKKSEIASEVHGDELPGHLGSFLDSIRDASFLLVFIATFCFVGNMPLKQTLLILIVLSVSWAFWKIVRSTWFSWSLLERLHRVLKEERYEIENHRPQEREELTALYAAKGFQGEMLEDVIDVLMADDERLLKIMMEEEMGLSLEHYEHPLKIGLGAFLGAMIAGALSISAYMLSPYAMIFVSTLLIACAAIYMAKLQKNDLLSACVWNLSGAVVLIGFCYFLTKWMQPFFQ